MNHLLSFVPALLVSPLTAQFTASLSANAPIQTVLATPSAAQPAGPLTSPGAVGVSLPIGATTLVADIQWTPPTSSSLTCSIAQQFSTGSLGGSFLPASFVCDTTFEVSGPAGAWGSLVVVANGFGMAWPLVDVRADGSNEALEGPFHGGIGPGALQREWSLPVQLGAAPLPVRIALPAVQVFTSSAMAVTVEFVPWSPNATDLGSGCTPNSVGWILGANSTHDYALAVLPGSGGAAATLQARGYGSFQVFAVDLQAARLPVGTIDLGVSCDDLLLGIGVTAPGQPAPGSAEDEWTLGVPQLPPGLTFYLQHVSLGSIATTIYFGATNVVRYTT